jgi:hypothetical protein
MALCHHYVEVEGIQAQASNWMSSAWGSLGAVVVVTSASPAVTVFVTNLRYHHERWEWQVPLHVPFASTLLVNCWETTLSPKLK